MMVQLNCNLSELLLLQTVSTSCHSKCFRLSRMLAQRMIMSSRAYHLLVVVGAACFVAAQSRAPLRGEERRAHESAMPPIMSTVDSSWWATLRDAREYVSFVGSILMPASGEGKATQRRESSKASASRLHVLLYETESDSSISHAHSLINQLSLFDGVEASIFGQGTDFEGFGSKYAIVYPILKDLDPDSLVVISDSRDVLVNYPVHSSTHAEMDRVKTLEVVAEFRRHYIELTKQHPEAVVISAEAQCCVSALTHAAPGDYYNADGSRNHRACASGEDGCQWADDALAVPWQNFMQAMATQTNYYGSDATYEDIYLNAGLMVGTAKNLINMIEKAQIGIDEDDQAVLTDYMYLNNDAIILDYGQTLFGNNRGGLGGMDMGSCVFGFATDNSANPHTMGRLIHSKTQSTPLFLHSPGGFFDCQDDLAMKLGLSAEPTRVVQRRLKEDNYGGGGNYKKKDDDKDKDKDKKRRQTRTEVTNVFSGVWTMVQEHREQLEADNA